MLIACTSVAYKLYTANEGQGNLLQYSTAYMIEYQALQRCTVLEVAADCHELMSLMHIKGHPLANSWTCRAGGRHSATAVSQASDDAFTP